MEMCTQKTDGLLVGVRRGETPSPDGELHSLLTELWLAELPASCLSREARGKEDTGLEV